MKPAQCGLTEMLMAEALRRQATAPCSVLYLLPTDATASKIMRDRLDKALRVPPFSSMRVRSRDLTRSFGGSGSIIFGSASAPSNLSSVPAKLIVGDEAARFPVDIGGEGDFASLAAARATTFSDARIVICSTPVSSEAGYGTFFGAIEAGDMRRYHCLCPNEKCGKHYEWSIDNMREVKEDEIVQECPHCGAHTHEGEERRKALREGKWVATKEAEHGTTSYLINGFLAEWPGATWADVNRKHKKMLRGVGSPTSFHNLVLGVPHSEHAYEQPALSDIQAYFKATDKYRQGYIPEGVVLLAGSIDVQKDWCAAALWGFGPNMETWLIERYVWPHVDEAQALMGKINEALEKTYYRGGHGTVKLNLHGFAVDARYLTTQVNEITQQYPSAVPAYDGWFMPQGSVISVMGATTQNNTDTIVSTPADARVKGKRKVHFTLGADLTKQVIYRALAAQIREARENQRQEIHMRLHLPGDLSPNYIEELVTEEARKKVDKYGRITTQFVLPSGKKNETLDLLIMASAFVTLMGGGALAWLSEKADRRRHRAKRPQTNHRGNGKQPGVATTRRRRRGYAT